MDEKRSELIYIEIGSTEQVTPGQTNPVTATSLVRCCHYPQAVKHSFSSKFYCMIAHGSWLRRFGLALTLGHVMRC